MQHHNAPVVGVAAVVAVQFGCRFQFDVVALAAVHVVVAVAVAGFWLL